MKSCVILKNCDTRSRCSISALSRALHFFFLNSMSEACIGTQLRVIYISRKKFCSHIGEPLHMTLVCNSFPVLANFRKTDNLISEFYFRKSWPLQKCMWPSCSNTCTLQEKFCSMNLFAVLLTYFCSQMKYILEILKGQRPPNRLNWC